MPEIDAPAAPSELPIDECLIESAPETIAATELATSEVTCPRERVTRVEDTAIALAWLQVRAVNSHHAREVVALLVKERHRRLLSCLLCMAHLAFVSMGADALLCWWRNIFAVVSPVSVTVKVN